MNHLTKTQQSLIYREAALSSQRRAVLLDVSGLEGIPLSEHNQNIYCIGPAGEVHWQVQAGSTIYDKDSFVSLTVDEEGKIRADRFFGNKFLIDPNTGVAEHIGWEK